jgi:carbamoyltransferase
MTAIIGISAFFHDSAATLLIDGRIIAAAQEERFSRIKHDASFPIQSINYILKEGKINLSDIDYVVFYEKPFLKFDRLISTLTSSAPKGLKLFSKAMPIWLREKLFLKYILHNQLKNLDKNFTQEKILFDEHHYSHAASAFFPSPFSEAIVITIDGVGEWATTTIGIGSGNSLEIIKEIHYPHSLGLLYSAFTYYIGFRVNSGEYKLMGLAPYGKPIYKDLILSDLIDVKEDGSFRLNQKYFNYSSGLTMTNKNFSKLFNSPRRKPESEKLSQFHMDIASSIQVVIEEIIIKIAKTAANEHKIDNLCLAGGVALNCVVNGKILKQNLYKNLWIQPAAGDAGGSLGAALSVWYKELNNERIVEDHDSMQGSFLGPSFNQEEIETSLNSCGAIYEVLAEDEIMKQTTEALIDDKAIGWFQGRMEFGPRALGNRSIIANPRSTDMQKILNLKIKYRESFRPFAPSVLKNHASTWFNIESDSPYMLIVSDVNKDKCSIKTKENHPKQLTDVNKKRSEIPAVTHVDYSARIHTVDKIVNKKFHTLINSFYKKSGCPMIVNTSFNVRGEPIVCSPNDAFKCFMGTEMELLIIGNCILKKDNQKIQVNNNYKKLYPLD